MGPENVGSDKTGAKSLMLTALFLPFYDITPVVVLITSGAWHSCALPSKLGRRGRLFLQSS